MIDPPEDARDAAAAAASTAAGRCWPAPERADSDVVLAAPIILYDHPAVAPESAVAMFDSTEIDEILTLRVMTLTDEEKAQARATDPRAAAIIDRCEAMSPEELQRLHGILREPAAADTRTRDRTTRRTPAAGCPSVGPRRPEARVHRTRTPSWSTASRWRGAAGCGCTRAGAPTPRTCSSPARRAGQRVHVDLDGRPTWPGPRQDPAADLHDWYGRYLYFAPDELEPLDGWKGKPTMRAVGMATVGMLVAMAPAPSLVGIRSVPDIQRYLKVRRM